MLRTITLLFSITLSSCATVATNPADYAKVTDFAYTVAYKNVSYLNRTWSEPKRVEHTYLTAMRFDLDIYGEHVTEALATYCRQHGHEYLEGIEGINKIFGTRRPPGFAEAINRLFVSSVSQKTIASSHGHLKRVGGTLIHQYCVTPSTDPFGQPESHWFAFVMPKPAWRELGAYASTDYSFLILENKSDNHKEFVSEAISIMKHY